MTASTPMWARVTNRDRGSFPSFAALPAVAADGDIAYIPQLVGREMIRMRYVATGGAWEVEPGQCLINAVDIFTVASAPSTADIVYTFPWVNNLIRPKQMWRVDAWATGVMAGGAISGFRTRFGGLTTNSAKTALSTVPGGPNRARHNKTISIRADGKIDTLEFDALGGTMLGEDPLIAGAYTPEIVFNPAQVGDSFTLKHYILRRLG